MVLLETSTPESVIGAFRCGASGVFCRTESLSELYSCIERVSRGEIWASPGAFRVLARSPQKHSILRGHRSRQIDQLSRREFQVAEHAAQGESNKQIAERLGLSEHTVKNYLFHVFEKLGVSNRMELLFLFSSAAFRLQSRWTLENDASQPIGAYLKAAEEGVVAAQFIVGLGHLEGYGIEKNERSAYYWLRMAEENSAAIEQRSPCSSGKIAEHSESRRYRGGGTDGCDLGARKQAAQKQTPRRIRSARPRFGVPANA